MENKNLMIVEKENQSISVTDTVSLVRTELETAIEQSHKFPRSIEKFRNSALSLACCNEQVAESCFYVVPRGGKTIEGAGIRLAEIVGSCWGNIRYGARVVNQTHDHITAQGVAHDLENNVTMTIEISRRIVDKSGRRYNDDMIVMTGNAACAIALRNAIFKVVPKVFVDEILEQAKKVAVGNATTLQARRDKAFGYFSKMGVKKDRVLEILGKKGENEIDLADIEKLLGIHTAIKEGTTTIDEIFGLTEKELKPKTKIKKEETETIQEENENDIITEYYDNKILDISMSKQISKPNLDKLIRDNFGVDSRSKITIGEAKALMDILEKL